jgi:multidrug efflux pump subunit AcrA (membrane-fusion protein)
MYATVVLKVERRHRHWTIPIEAISSDKKTSVYMVNNEQEIEERPVTLGLETPGKYEVVDGLKEGDLVVIGRLTLTVPITDTLRSERRYITQENCETTALLAQQ